MDEATKAQLFQPFFTTKEVGRGTGLGLATAKVLIERAGGAIRVASQPGRGTQLTIQFPELPSGGPPRPDTGAADPLGPKL